MIDIDSRSIERVKKEGLLVKTKNGPRPSV